MRIKLMIAAAALATGACTPMAREFRSSGGYPGHKLDEIMFDASHSKQAHLLRYAIVLAMTAQVAKSTTVEGKEGDAFVDYLVNVVEDFNDAAASAYLGDEAACATPGLECQLSKTPFETQLSDLERGTMRLVFASLPRERTAAFANALKGGDVAAAAFRALRLAISSIDGGRRGAAVYRSGLETYALLVAAEGRCADPALTPDGIVTVNHAVSCIGLSETSLTNPKGMKRLPAKVPEAAFAPLFDIVRQTCMRLPRDTGLTPGQTKEQAAEAAQSAFATRKEACDALTFAPKRRFGRPAATVTAVSATTRASTVANR